MGSAKMALIHVLVFSLLLLFPWCFSSEIVGERSLVIAPSVVMQLSKGVPVRDSPGKLGKSMTCERVIINGLSRVKHLSKFAHSAAVKVSQRNSSAYILNAEVCFHRNKSLATGMCSENQWEKMSKGVWVRHMSPFDNKVLDIRTTGSSLERYEISIEEEYFFHRIIFLGLGLLLLSVAAFLSKSLVFYYGSAMAIGIILVILVLLFQGMKLIPFGGRKLAFFIPSSIAGVVILVKQVAPGFVRTVLVLVGLDEELYDPVVKFLMAFLVLAGAWMGFWVVRKLILTDDGSIDVSTSVFVAWSIRSLGALMIFQSSGDPVLGIEALLLGIVVSSILRKIFRLRFIRRVYRKLKKAAKKNHRVTIPESGSSASEESFDEGFEEITYGSQSNGGLNFVRRPERNLAASPDIGLSRKSPNQQRDTNLYLSSFHSIPKRKQFSEEGWEKFTEDSTQRALDELSSSPGFGKWLHQNADRIHVTHRGAGSERLRRKWLIW